MAIKITDLVDSREIDKLKELDDELLQVLNTYTNVARELAKGLEIKISGLNDIERLEKLLAEKGKEASAAQQQLTRVIAEQSKVVANTTNTISRQLMEQERVNKTQREAYTEHERVKRLLEQCHDTYRNQTLDLVSLNTELEANKKAQKENEKALAAGRITMEQFQASQAELISQHRTLTQEKRALNQLMTAEEKALQTQEGSYAHMSQQLELLKKAYKGLGEEGRKSDFGKEMEEAIQNLDAHLKDMAADMGEFQRNVGNYAISSSVKKDLKELVLEIANLSLEYQNLSEEEKASAEGQELAEHIRGLTEKAGTLKDAIADTNAAITNAASDTRTFDQLGGTIQLAIDGFGLAQGAAAMLGISEQELSVIQTKLQAAIAASNAMQSIQNKLQQQSAVMQGANTVQLKLRTLAEKTQTAAQGKGLIATKAATAAQWAFNAAANANPIGLIVVAIIAAAAAVWGLVKAFNAFIGPSEDANKQLAKQIEKIEQLKQSHRELISVLEASGASSAQIATRKLQYVEDEIAAMDRAIAAAEKNNASNEKIAELRRQRRDKEKEQLDQYESQYFGLSKLIREQDLLELEQKKGSAAVKRRLLNEEIDGQKMLIEQMRATAILHGWQTEKLDQALDALEKKRANGLKEINKETFRSTQSSLKDIQSAVRKGEDDMLKLITNSTDRKIAVENTAYKRKIEDLKNEIKETKTSKQNAAKIIAGINVQIQAAERLHRKALETIALENARRLLGIEDEFNQLKLDGAKASTAEEIKEISQLRLNSLDIQRRQELLTLQKSLNDGNISEDEAQEQRTLIALKYSRMRQSEEESAASKVAELAENKYAKEQEVQNNAFIREENALKQKYAEELAAAKGNAAKQEAITERYESDRSALSERYAQETAQHSIDMIEEVLKNEQLSAEDRLKYEQELAKAKGVLETAMADATIAQVKRTTDADNKAAEKRKANARQWLQVAADSLNAINDLASEVYDAKITKVEEEQEANEAAGEAEIERVTQLVEQKVITEEEGEARKRAAEAATAKKNEELEKQKQQLKQKQAIWDKANSIAQIGISTAMAIMNAMANIPAPGNVAMAAVAGAMGAIQLATVIATPLPKYAKGTEHHKGGPAIVGDGGVPELVIFGGKSWVTPDTPTIVDLPAGAIVRPSIDGLEDIAYVLAGSPAAEKSPSPIIINNDYKRLEEKMDAFIYVLRKHAASQRKASADLSTSRYISNRI